MTSMSTQAPVTMSEWLIALVSARPEDQRAVAFAGVEAGYAMHPVVCILHGRTFRWVGMYRHLAETEKAYRAAHLEDGPNAGLHRIGHLREAVREDAPAPFPWEIARCRSCRAEIVFAVTALGKRTPVDVATNPNGNVQLVAQSLEQSIYEPPFANVLHTAADAAGIEDQLHMSHFATCPKAADWRRSP